MQRNLKILLIGQCTLHWGRLEYGNIGNYYIIEPFIRELKKKYPGSEIRTTFQMSDQFCQREGITVLPMEYYYGWSESDLSVALEELSIATLFHKTGVVIRRTPYIEEVEKSALVIDFSGDIWGDNANFLGPHRFLVGLCKDRVAQLLNKPTYMLAGSPGPFGNQSTLEFAKEVYANFDLVTNREPVSIKLLDEDGFDTSNTKSLACPSFLFEKNRSFDFLNFLKKEKLPQSGRPRAGFILCGWNFETGPFDQWPREGKDFEKFAESVEHMIRNLGMDVYLMSHSNGFAVPPEKFEMEHGRDYPVIKKMQSVLHKRGVKEHLYSIDGVYNPWDTKAIIGHLDLLVSGRVHGAIAGLSQKIPTVIIDYGHEPKAHKLLGFARVLGIENFVADPSSATDLIEKIGFCQKNVSRIRKHLEVTLLDVETMAAQNFEILPELPVE